jgi:hypothetical protein
MTPLAAIVLAWFLKPILDLIAWCFWATREVAS